MNPWKARLFGFFRAVFPLLPPAALILLFRMLQNFPAVMDFWVFRVAAPLERFLARLWAFFPLSGLELCVALVVLGVLAWLAFCIRMLWRERSLPALFRRLAALVALALWLWCALCWLWNAAYYAADFSSRSGLNPSGSTVEQLSKVTAYFAENAARLSTQVPRDEQGLFSLPVSDCLSRGVSVYDNLSLEFPCLAQPSTKAKPLLCSRFQSILGFTGMYFPFTGEANVNVDAPLCLLPATIAHEMAHQRMVASELEANFVGIAACTTSDDPVYQYSGYLMGLLQLCNALYPLDGESWRAIVTDYFTPELVADWNDNNAYWAALSSPVEETAGNLYDSFLKSNDQALGMQSYGACVDLILAYYGGFVSA